MRCLLRWSTLRLSLCYLDTKCVSYQQICPSETKYAYLENDFVLSLWDQIPVDSFWPTLSFATVCWFSFLNIALYWTRAIFQKFLEKRCKVGQVKSLEFWRFWVDHLIEKSQVVYLRLRWTHILYLHMISKITRGTSVANVVWRLTFMQWLPHNLSPCINLKYVVKSINVCQCRTALSICACMISTHLQKHPAHHLCRILTATHWYLLLHQMLLFVGSRNECRVVLKARCLTRLGSW